MVELKAFKPVEYDAGKVDFASVVAPPFDVIDQKQTKDLHGKSPYNVTHLTVAQGKTAAGQVKKPGKGLYEKVAKRFADWLEEGVLVERGEPAIYAYEARYTLDGAERRMRGVVGLLRIDPEYDTVLPHEQIFDKPVEERLGLLMETAVDLEPIELLYPGKTAEEPLWAYVEGTSRSPDLLATGPDGTQHLFWRITDPPIIGTVTQALKGKKVYIADGHHRYATHIAYAKRRRSGDYRPPKDAPYDYKLSVLVNMDDPGLAVLPTHRVVLKAKRKRPDAVLEALADHFEIEALDGDGSVRERAEAAMADADKPTFALYFGKKGGLHQLTTKQMPLTEDVAPGKSFVWRTLDVAFLQHLIVGQGFGVPEKKWGDDVRYTQDWDDAVGAVDKGKAVGVGFHRPVRTQQLRAVADAGEVMPQKSTFFVPKLLSGACFYRIGKEPAGQLPKKPTS